MDGMSDGQTPAARPNRTRYDVVVVGGGAAGLSGALTLARARRSVLVVDEGTPRNAPADAVHNYLGREGTPPAELYAIGRDEVAGYGGEVIAGTVVEVRAVDGEFRVAIGAGPAVEARRLLVATGLTDELPDIPGLREHWGTRVLHCPYCHGWEVRDRPVGIIATGPLVMHAALLWPQWTPHVTLFLNDAFKPGAEESRQLAVRGVTAVEGAVAAFEADRGVRLAGGDLVPVEYVVVPPAMTARAGLLEQLGLTPAELELAGHRVGTYVAADPLGATAVPGVYVAGNVGSLMDQVIVAAGAGLRAAAAINADLVAEETAG
jgi:thioredoxin reductase (NADPH)